MSLPFLLEIGTEEIPDWMIGGALEYLGVPYTGSGVMGSAIGMDKLRTKRLAQAIGVATADYVVLRGPQDFEITIERLGDLETSIV